MKGLHYIIGLFSTLFIAQSALAVDLSKVPDFRKVNIIGYNKSEVAAGRRPEHCERVYDKSKNDLLCYDGVISEKEAIGYYANSKYRLGKPLTEGNKARENAAGLDKIIEKIEIVYGGTEKAILNKEPELNRTTAGLFNTFIRASEDVQPYVLSIANGHYDKETLDKLQIFNNVFTNGWQKSAPAMVKYQGITEEEAVGSSRYYKQELDKIRNILAKLNKYYQ